MTRTFLKGKAPKSVMRAYNAVKKASETAMSMIRAGVIAADVHIAASETMAGLGFQTGRGRDGMPCGFIHGAGARLSGLKFMKVLASLRSTGNRFRAGTSSAWNRGCIIRSGAESALRIWWS